MPTLTILPSGQTVDASEGDTILFALLVGGVPIKTECTGKAQCSCCHILVHAGGDSLSKIAGPESNRFKDMQNIQPNSRLACQAVVGTGDATIEVVPEVQYQERNVDV
jgi:2Fe-2S ferredoxin